MRIRPVPLIAVIFGGAAVTAAFVVAQLPREGAVSPVARTSAPARMPVEASPLAPPALPSDAVVEVKVTAGREPQAGAYVRLYLAPDAAEARWRRAGHASSGPDGVARIPARPGAYLVAARAAGLAPGLAEVVRMRGEELARADVELEPGESLRGLLRAPGGAPGARLSAVPHFSRWPGLEPPSAPPEESAAGEVRPDGTFALEGLSPGAWAVSVEAAGYHPFLLPHVAVPGPPVEIVLEPLATIAGVVLDAGGHPAPGALVRAASRDHGASSRAGADGRFRLEAPAGTYDLSASIGGAAGAAPAPVTLGPGGSAQGVEIRLGPAASVAAAVTLAGGGPAPGAELALYAHGTREMAGRAVTDPDGRAVVRDLAPGAYDLRAVARGASSARLDGVTLGAGVTFPVRIALPGTGAVEGTVRDPGGRALGGVRVRAVPRAELLARAPVVEARTDFEGRFRLDRLEAGRTELLARLPGVLAGATGAVEVRDGATARADLVLPEAGLLAGRVRDDGGGARAGITVVAVPTKAGSATPQAARVAADATGNFQLALPAGEYRVHAARLDASAAEPRVVPSFASVEPRRTTRLDLELAQARPDEAVEILVLEPGGAPSPGALVTLARPDDGRIALATAAGDAGRVAIDRRMGISGQRVTIRARSGGRTGEQTLVLPMAGTVPVQLAPAGTLEGVVRGAGVSGFTLEVSSRPERGAWRVLDVHRFAGDRFALGDVPAEPLRLEVRTGDGRRGTAEVRVAPGEKHLLEIALRR